MLDPKKLYQRRCGRNRRRIRAVSNGRARLCVFRSNKNIYAQIIDDLVGRTLAAASTLDQELRLNLQSGSDVNAAKEVGALIAKRGKAIGVTELVFDRGGYLYHGRVRALAEAARENGLKF